MMSMIFPGMDPYLEDPWLWQSVHARLMVNLADLLNPVLQPNYLAVVEGRMYLEGSDRQARPDVLIRRDPSPRVDRAADSATLLLDRPIRIVAVRDEVIETSVAILDLKRGKKVVAVIEVVSPSNKTAGPGRKSYLQKQREILGGDVHLVEIDLLRKGRHVLAVPSECLARPKSYDYLISVNRGEDDRDVFEAYPKQLRDRLPRIAIPLGEGDPDVGLDIQAALEKTYEMGYYRKQIDYKKPCVPPLSADDQAWADGLIRAAGESEATT